MAALATAIPGYKFRLHITSRVKPLLNFPHTIRFPNKFHSYPSQKSNKIRANIKDVPTPANLEEDILRGCLKNQPRSVWDQSFVSLAPHDSEIESRSKDVEEVKVKVKNMFLHSTRELADNIDFIYLLCRLGVSYHFEDEINEQLNQVFTMLPKLLEDHDFDLCTLANLFRILRQHGYKMTCDVFEKFKDEDGKFEESITNDVNGILSLYEASFLATPGEDILDEALAFTRKHLESLAQNSSLHLQKHIKTTLMCPSQRTFERRDVFQYISFYEEDEYADETLLKFAKLDYNGVQLLYRKELSLLSSWWENLNVAENIPYARDRLVECYIWAVGSVFEPQYGLSRIFITKYAALVTLMDDSYDSYGTIEELRLFTSAMQRFNIEAADKLPKPMQFLYRAIFELVENEDIQGLPSKRTFAREMFIELARSYNLETSWLKEKKAPSMDEYTKNGKVTSCHDICASAFLLGAKNMGMKEMLWLRSNPQLVAASQLYIRFLNDISMDETDREDFPKVHDCYMKQFNASKDEAIEAIQKIVENNWKEMNEDLLKPTTIPRVFRMHALNYARNGHMYSYPKGDWFTYAHNLKSLITSLFLNPLPMY